MKIKLLTLLLLSTFTSFVSCKKDTETVVNDKKMVSEKNNIASNDEAVKMLSDFYYAYLNETATATDLPAS